MMKTRINVDEKPDLEDPILIEGLPGIGNVGRITAGYLIKELGAKKFAELHSPHFLPLVLLHDDVVNTLKSEFYYWKNEDGKNDLIFLVGDCQCGESGSEGHYEIAETVLDLAEDLGVEKLITLGGFGTGDLEEERDKPDVLGAVSDSDLIEKYDDLDIEFEETPSRVGMIVGATGLLLGLGKLRGIEGLCLMGETAGFPILTDPKSAEEVIKVLMKIIDVDVEMEKLDERVDEMENFLKKLENIQNKAMKQLQDKQNIKGEENLRYIG
ncbi:MAG: proteasome assembly chaperone family protein [Candidatus Aenigmatarchaeota archaeon]